MSTMYTLTAMTGKEAASTRTVVIGTVEFNWRVLMILIWVSPIALFATVLAWPILGQISIVMIPIVEGAAIFLLHRRSSQGLKLRTYQAVWDRRKAALDTFLLCGQRIETGTSDYRILVNNVVAYVPPEAAPSHAYVDTLMAQPLPAGVTPVAALDRPHDSGRGPDRGPALPSAPVTAAPRFASSHLASRSSVAAEEPPAPSFATARADIRIHTPGAPDDVFETSGATP